MRHVYAYIRVSTQKQGETGSSLIEQRRAISAYAERNNLSIIEWFEEQETAAKRGRTIFTRMLALLVAGHAQGVVIHKIDRGARNLRDWADLGGLIDRGIEVYFAHESLDMQSRGGRLAADIQAVVAADYIRNLRDEVKKGFYGRLRQGLYPLPAPIGYQDQGRGLPKTPDPVTGPLVQQAFSLYETGQYNLRTLGQEMYRRGLRNRGGGRVTRNGLSKMLNNPFYTGRISIRLTGEQFAGTHEPLIRQSQFLRVQQVLRGRKKNGGLKHEFLYRRALRCTHCGYSIIAELQKGTAYYRCHTATCPITSLREEAIEAQVAGALRALILTDFELAQLRKYFQHFEHDRRADSENEKKSLELRRSNILERLSRLAEAYEMRALDAEALQRRNQALINERLSIETMLQNIGGDADPAYERRVRFLEQLQWLNSYADQAEPFEKRDALISATSNLQIDTKKLVCLWKEPFQALCERSNLSGNSMGTKKAHSREPISYFGEPPQAQSRIDMRKLARTLFDLLSHDESG